MAKTGTKKKKSVSKTSVDTSAGAYLAELLALKKKGEPGFGTLEDALYSEVTDRIPTGSLGLDKLLGGGWPEGRIVEVASWEGVGKSTLLDQAAAQVQKMGGVAALLDTEKARDLVYTKKLGVDTSSVILGEADDIEGVFEILEDLLTVQTKKRLEMEKLNKKPPPMLVLWDSVGGTPSRREVSADPGSDHVSPAARAISANFRRLVQLLPKNRITLVFANHFYTKIGGFGGLSTYGGKGVRYYPSVRLWLSRKGSLKIGEQVVGHAIEAKLKKSRVGPPRDPVELGLVHNAGIDNSYTLFQWALGAESSPGEPWIVTTGAHRYLRPPGREPIHFQKGFSGLAEILNNEPDIYSEMAQSYVSSE